MTLAVHTARINVVDPDRFDVTRKSGGPNGAPFAPSWAILNPALEARRVAVRDEPIIGRRAAMAIEGAAWAAYVPAYTAEMRASYRANRAAWDALLARERVCLVCYCVGPMRCHRRLLAQFLEKLGAQYWGEVAHERKGARP